MSQPLNLPILIISIGTVAQGLLAVDPALAVSASTVGSPEGSATATVRVTQCGKPTNSDGGVFVTVLPAESGRVTSPPVVHVRVPSSQGRYEVRIPTSQREPILGYSPGELQEEVGKIIRDSCAAWQAVHSYKIPVECLAAATPPGIAACVLAKAAVPEACKLAGQALADQGREVQEYRRRGAFRLQAYAKHRGQFVGASPEVKAASFRDGLPSFNIELGDEQECERQEAERMNRLMDQTRAGLGQLGQRHEEATDRVDRARQRYDATAAQALQQQMMMPQQQLMMSDHQSVAGNATHCSQARAQIRELQRALEEVRPYTEISGAHREAAQLYEQGVRVNQQWYDANCR